MRDETFRGAWALARVAAPAASRVDALTTVAEAACGVGRTKEGLAGIDEATSTTRTMKDKAAARALVRVARASAACGGSAAAVQLALGRLRSLPEASRNARIRALAADACRAGTFHLVLAELNDPAPNDDAMARVSVDLAREGLGTCALEAADAVPAEGQRAHVYARLAAELWDPETSGELEKRASRMRETGAGALAWAAVSASQHQTNQKPEALGSARRAVELATGVTDVGARAAALAAAVRALARAGAPKEELVATVARVEGAARAAGGPAALAAAALAVAVAGHEVAALRLAEEARKHPGDPSGGGDVLLLAAKARAAASDVAGAVALLGAGSGANVDEALENLGRALIDERLFLVAVEVARSMEDPGARSGVVADAVIGLARARRFDDVEQRWQAPEDRDDQTFVCVEAAIAAVRASKLDLAQRFVEHIDDPLAQGMLGSHLYVEIIGAKARAGACREALSMVGKIAQRGERAKALAAIGRACE